MSKRFSNSLFICGILMLMAGFISSCEEDAVFISDSARPYFPMDTGKYFIYQVDSVIYRETQENDTIRIQLKEEITEIFEDNEGRPTYRIERFKRGEPSEAWQIINVWTANITDQGFERVENNLRFLKMTNILGAEKTWNGSTYLGDLSMVPVSENCNNLQYLEDWEYSYEDIHVASEINGVLYDSTVTVFQEGSNNLLELNNATEVYARGIGLISREFYHLTTQQICAECPWAEKAECGYLQIMKLIEHN